MTTNDEVAKMVQQLADAYAHVTDSDIMLYSGGIHRQPSDQFLELVAARTRRRKSVILMLCTSGGDPDAAYRIARCLQQNYTEFTVLVGGWCKSAGTLMVLGANHVVMNHFAELGPLDVQVTKADEVFERSSGLTPTKALETIDGLARRAFQEMFIQLKFELGLTTHTAAEVSSNMIGNMYDNLLDQIDPLVVGELGRYLSVAHEYGQRLISHSKNMEPDALPRLIVGYPSHGFVIDAMEARQLFRRVRAPTDPEQLLLETHKNYVRYPKDDEATIRYINTEVPTAAEPATVSTHPGAGKQHDEVPTDDHPAEGGKPEDRGSPEGQREEVPVAAGPDDAPGAPGPHQPDPPVPPDGDQPQRRPADAT